MRILLLTSYSGEQFNNAPPIGLYRLKNFVEDAGIPCDILDLSLDSPDSFLVRAAAGEFAIIGISVSHYHMIEDLKLIERFLEATTGQHSLVIAGGQEASYNFEQWLDGGVQAVILGYGERPLLRMAQTLRDNPGGGVEAISRIPGIVCRVYGLTKVNPALSMTRAEFELLTYEKVLLLDVPYERYWEQARQHDNALNFRTSQFVSDLVRVYTASHCPNRCGFCSSHRFLTFSQGRKSKIFMLDAPKVFHLIMHYVKQYGAKGVLFSDDEFLVSRERAEEFLELLIHARHTGVLPNNPMLNCQARVTDFLSKKNGGIVDRPFLKLLLEAGFHSVSLGVESFSERLLATSVMNKRGYSEKQAINLIDTMLEVGLVPQVNIILFIPEATREDILHNIRRGMEIISKGCTIALTTYLFSIPGAPIYLDPGYPTTLTRYISRATGRNIDVTGYFIPHDPVVAMAAEALPEVLNTEIDRFIQTGIWPYGKLHKTLIGILTFIAIADVFGETEQAESWREALAAFVHSPGANLSSPIDPNRIRMKKASMQDAPERTFYGK